MNWLADTYKVIRSYILADCYRNCVCALCFSLNTSCSIRLAVQTPTNLWHQNPVIIFTSLHNPNLFRRWKRIPNQLLFKSSLRVISFASKNSIPHLGNIHQPKTIFLIFSAPICLLPQASFQIQQHGLTSSYTRSMLCLLTNQLVF